MRTYVALLLAACSGAAPTPAPLPTPTPTPTPTPVAPAPAPPEAPAEPPRPATPIADAHRDAAEKILALALAPESNAQWKMLEHLTDRIGHRLSGSEGLETAVKWALERLEADGHANVRAEKVMVPHWVRGEQSAEILAPVARPLPVLALGSSVATPKKGVTAEVVVVSSLEDLAKLPDDRVKGKIILFNKVMPAYTKEGGTRYGEVARVRMDGPAAASRRGAAAVLVRSVTARSLRTLHGGSTLFPEGVKPLPAAAITTEDADLLARYAAAGETPRVRLTLGAKFLPEKESANVVGELVGREKPDEVVVIAAHLDSWDLGQGAHDDGAGVVTMMQALTTLRTLGLTPRRTIRVVLYTNEENGIRGALAYPEAHKDELAKHVAALEADSGGFAPDGFSVTGPPEAVAAVADIASLLAPISATDVHAGFGGVDIMTLGPAGVPQLGLGTDGSHYFDYHHTEADTLDKVNPDELKRCVAAAAVMAYVLAEMPEPLPRIPPAAKAAEH